VEERADATRYNTVFAVFVPAGPIMDTRTALPTQRREFSLNARPEVVALRNSKIREVANAGIGLSDVLPFWFGEPDEVTPEFICRAGIESIARGETFYSQNFGIPELRGAISAYMSRLHGPIAEDRIAVTSSGMSALMHTMQALVGHGDRVVAVTPVWPNLVEGPRILGAQVATVALQFEPKGWKLDLERLIDALTPDTKVLLVNSPNNPTGWTMGRAEQQVLLEHCRYHGIWIVADDAYERIYFEAAEGTQAAPSFLDIAHPDDRLVNAYTFSKSWLMTGWRLGWLAAPPPLIEDIGKLIEYNFSCVPVFVQRAGAAAIEGGDATIAHTVARYRKARDYLVAELSRLPGIEAATTPGAMYAFFKVDGMTDSLSYCTRLVREARLGLAPGVAFGPEGEGFLRWCFAASEENLAEGIKRFKKFQG
jgi:aspartate/methionine/tyrosine aminotransferase